MFSQLIELAQAHSEEFLTQPQQFEGLPGSFLIWKMLAGDGYEHYRQHMRSIRAWLDRSAARQ